MSLTLQPHLELPHTRFAGQGTREVWRVIRSPGTVTATPPDSEYWHAFNELRRRGENPSSAFIGALRSVHRSRSFERQRPQIADPDPEDYKLCDDPYLVELWRSFKRCVCAGRNGPAGQLLREMEKHLGVAG